MNLPNVYGLELDLNKAIVFDTFCEFQLDGLIAFQGPKMGQCEFRYLYMHAMFWDPQKSWGTYIKGDVLFFYNLFFYNLNMV